MATKVGQFIGELNAGVVEQQLSAILSEVASAVVTHGKAGKVVFTMDLKQISNSHQVNVTHDISYKRPHSQGTKQENFLSSTPMYVGTKGAMTFFPEKQGQFFDQKGNVDQHIPGN